MLAVRECRARTTQGSPVGKRDVRETLRNLINKRRSLAGRGIGIEGGFLARLLSLTASGSQAQADVLTQALLDMAIVRWDTKVMGYALARALLGTTDMRNLPVKETLFSPSWRPTISDDFFSGWFRDICALLKIEPILHRKLWEFAYTIGCLSHYGKLQSGSRALGFGCGKEPLPSFLASRGISVLATDLEPSSLVAKGWIDTAQHASSRAVLWRPELVERPDFDARVSLRHVDMNEIPPDLDGGFDFCWSICALEHLGSIEKGLKFIRNSLDTLRPGGIAVHTTEFNCFSDSETIQNGPTVLFRRKDLGEVYQRLMDEGFELPSLTFAAGDTPIDWFVDLPPYRWQPEYFDPAVAPALHLKVGVEGFPSTCFGIVVRKPL